MSFAAICGLCATLWLFRRGSPAEAPAALPTVPEVT